MTDTLTSTTELSALDQAKQQVTRIRKKRAKKRGNEYDLTNYLLGECPVPLDQLELTPQELAHAEEIKQKRAQWEREAEEKRERELAERKAMVEESASKAKQSTVDAEVYLEQALKCPNIKIGVKIVPVDADIFDTLATAGVHFVRFSFDPHNRGWKWGGGVSGLNSCLGSDYEKFQKPRPTLVDGKYQPHPSSVALSEQAEAIVTLGESWLKERFPDDYLVKGTIDLHVTERIAYVEVERVTSWTARGVSDPNGFVGVLIDDDEDDLLEGVETLEELRGVFESIETAMDDVNDYKTQVAHSTTNLQQVINSTPGLATPEILLAMINDMLNAIESYGGDRYERKFRIVRCPEDADNCYAIVDLASYDYSTEDVEIVGGLGYHDSYKLADDDDDDWDDGEAVA